MDGFAVTPELLAEAATTITTALGDGAVGRPIVTGGGAYGHDELAGALAEFGSAVQLAASVLVKQAEAASAGLRAGADAYAQAEQRGAAELTATADRTAPAGGGR